jgi:hypothetical protein
MRPEDRLQSRVRMFLDAYLSPPVWWSSVGHERKQTLAQGAAQKARGIRRGLPDVMIWAPSYFLGVELKAGKNGTTDAQNVFQAQMAVLGHGYEVVRSVEQLGEKLVQHGIPLAGGWRIAAQLHDHALDGATPPRKPSKPRTPKPTRTQVAAGNRVALAMARGGK